MSTFLLTYRAPADYQGGDLAAQSEWGVWFASIGDRILDIGNPVFARETLGSVPAATVLGGYSIISAEDFSEARSLAEGCPFLRIKGGVEIGELTLLNPLNLATSPADHPGIARVAT
jgi:hypothetical protein